MKKKFSFSVFLQSNYKILQFSYHPVNILLIRYIATGLIILGTGSFLFTMPHFLSSSLPIPGSNLEGTEESIHGNLCHDRQQIGNASEQELQTSLSYHRGWFILGQIFHGIGAAPILTLGNENPIPIFECKHNAFGAKCIFDYG